MSGNNLVGTCTHGLRHLVEYPLYDVIRNQHPRFVLVDGREYKIIRQTKRNRIFRRDGCQCKCCGLQATIALLDTDWRPYSTATFHLYGWGGNHWIRLTLDHIIPRCHGGSNAPENLQLLCSRCNHIKSDKQLSLRELRCLVN